MQNPTSPIKAVIFDLDNTLIATNLFVLNHIKETVAQINLQYGNVLPLPTDSAISDIQKLNCSFEEIFEKLFAGEFQGKKLSDFVLEEYRKTAMSKTIIPTLGAIDAITELTQQNIKIGIVTNRNNKLEERLTQAGFDLRNLLFISAPTTPDEKKPNPNALKSALKILADHSIYPANIAFIGDHLDDFAVAKYQGLYFIGLLQGSTTKQDFVDAGLEESLIVPSLSNIMKTLELPIRARVYHNSLTNVSALDGRHSQSTIQLREFISEFALHKYRIKAEVEHIIALSEFFKGEVVRTLTAEETQFLRNLYNNFTVRDAYEVLQYDHLGRNGIGPTEHDVKSCELWIREKLQPTSLADVASKTHIFATSEDINNLAYKTMIAGAVNEVFLPKIFGVCETLSELSETWKSTPVMARTHLQPASPTTFGKIFAVYLARLGHGVRALSQSKLQGKFNGAVGNYNAFVGAYPNLDWISYSKFLVNSMGFECELMSDQRGPHRDIIRVFQIVQEMGSVLRDFSQDLSLYAGFGNIIFHKIESHVGSSVMPHKINPWFAEVAEGNIKKANYLINCLSNELDISRMQRDLSDHDLERSYGEALGYVLVALEHLEIALSLIHPNVEYSAQEINSHAEIFTEGMQTILRKHNIASAYDLFKTAFRGKQISLSELRVFVATLPVADEARQELMEFLDAKSFIGKASELCEYAVNEYQNFRQENPLPFLTEQTSISKPQETSQPELISI